MKNESLIPKNVGAANPYAIAELVMKKKINWKSVDSKALLEKTFDMPYEELFDPKNGSPLYAGVNVEGIRGNLKITPKVSSVLEVGAVEWRDMGDYFEEASEMLDPVQGALGDCYFIAALSSVAWARTYVIAQRTRATANENGSESNAFVDMIQFYNNGVPKMIEVTEKVPVNTPGNTYIYAHSSDTGEIWPAVYEKAYAKFRTNSSSDQPNYAPLAGGDPVGACAQLTGLQSYYFGNSSMTENQIMTKIKENCVSCKTFNPMVAWTYSSSPSPSVNYNNAHIAANHAYSILGWHYVNNQQYVVLRNPWGYYEATLNSTSGIWTAFDAPYYGGPGFLRSINLANTDGVFALRTDIFKSHFAGFGLVK
jgi:hypothetical protein